MKRESLAENREVPAASTDRVDLWQVESKGGGDPSGFRQRADAGIVLDETTFERCLLLERRRSERNGARFALMLIDLEAIHETLSMKALEEVGRSMVAALRDTDIAGWYRSGRIFGAILTTLNDSERRLVEPVLLDRTMKALRSSIPPVTLEQVNVTFHFFPDSGVGGLPVESHTLFYPERGTKGRRASDFLKRSMDILGSLGALIVLSPVFVAVALAIRLTSEGPVFFRQTRIGRHGREFTFLKFRSMEAGTDSAIHEEYVRSLIQNNAAAGNGAFKLQDDPRVTRVGRLIRKTSLDELPQFINVLRGDMSLVGPRPPIPYELESYALWHRRRILEAKPGITGEWQVYGRSRTTFDEMVRMDLRYIETASLRHDIEILIKTPWAVLRGDGAY